MESSKDKSFKKAEERVENLKKFYKHVITFILINLFLAFVWKFSFKIFGDFVISNQFSDAGFTHIPIWFIWGVFLAVDALKTFGFTSRFAKSWEERKVQEFMND